MSTKNEILIHAQGLDSETLAQIYRIASIPAFEGKIAIMPDAHAGAGCCIGFTAKIKDYICPNFVGVDIGCGVRGRYIGDIRIDYDDLDGYLKQSIPLGMKHRVYEAKMTQEEKVIVKEAMDVQKRLGIDLRPASHQVGTLGGGNHFIEIGEGKLGKWIFIHSGSRNFGLKVAEYYQKLAAEKNVLATPKGMEVLAIEDGGVDYLRDMSVAQRFARVNRDVMMRQITDYLQVVSKYDIDCVHNYIGNDFIIRKGAISAYAGEPVLIPLNMRDGTVIGRGKQHYNDPLGNPDYNYSAPHGAGRMFGRGQMKRKLQSGEITLQDFEKEMEGIATSSVNANTIDESPMAYKPFSMIKEYLEETVSIIDIVKPVYNLKGGND